MQPSAGPSLLPQPSGTSVGVLSQDDQGTSTNKAVQRGYIAGAVVFVALVALVAFFAWKRRYGATPNHVRIDEEDKEDVVADGSAEPSPSTVVTVLERADLEGEVLVPESTRIPSILKTQRFSVIQRDRVEEPRRSVRFDVPSPAPSSSFGDDKSSSHNEKSPSASAVEAAKDRQAWFSWINPIIDPINACTGNCQGLAAADSDIASATSYDDSSTASMSSPMLNQYEKSSQVVSNWRKAVAPPPQSRSVLGIRDRTAVDKDDASSSVRRLHGTDTTLLLPSEERGIRTNKEHKQDTSSSTATSSMLEAKKANDRRRISLGEGPIEL